MGGLIQVELQGGGTEIAVPGKLLAPVLFSGSRYLGAGRVACTGRGAILQPWGKDGLLDCLPLFASKLICENCR